jgi:MFS superfamily sulfate permease-like transporter
MSIKTNNNLNPFKNFKYDIPASIVVFLVAMPLCLGIALASGAPLFSGLISGIIGGIVVGSLSGSALGVSGPAAGLAVIVFDSIRDLNGPAAADGTIGTGGFEIFLVAVILAGIIQIILGFLKAGIIGYYFPTSVIHGMLAGIGIIIFLKQIPHAFGYDKVPEGDETFNQVDGHNIFSELGYMMDNISYGVLIISVASLLFLILWDTKFMKKFKITKIIPGPLVAVALGIFLNEMFKTIPSLTISSDHLVTVPLAESVSGFFSNFTFPNFTDGLTNPKVYGIAFLIAGVASIETLLSVEASDKQDDYKRITPTNRELKAQGIGNIIAGFVGGLPVTQVIVRSSANQQTGGKTKASTIMHGILIIISIIAIPVILNKIPLGVLAAILFVVAFKLSKPALYKKMYKQGWGQFSPFLVTVVGIVLFGLLLGITLGCAVAIFIILRNNFKIPFKLRSENLKGKENVTIHLSEDVTFLNKASIQKTLAEIPNDTHVTIDASDNHFIHYDVTEIIEDFEISAKSRNIVVTIIDLYTDKEYIPAPHFEIIENK